MQKTKYTVKKASFLIVSLFSLYGCVSSGSLKIEKSEDFQSHIPKINSIVSLEPDFQRIDLRKTSEDKYIRSSNGEERFNDLLVEMGNKSGIKVVVVDQNSLQAEGISYFNDEAQLRKEIYQVTFFQEINAESKFKFLKGIRKNFQAPWADMGKGPRISSAFSYLSSKYKTPFFSINGVVSIIKPVEINYPMLICNPFEGIISFFKTNNDTYYYSIIANVETGRIIYKEVRKCLEKPREEIIRPMVYDSFKILKN